MSEFVKNLSNTEISVFGVRVSLQGKSWGLLRSGHSIEMVEEGIAQQVVTFLNTHAPLPRGAVLHMDAAKAALMAVQDADFRMALLGGYKIPNVLELHVNRVAFCTKDATFRLPVRVHEIRNLLEVRTVNGKLLPPLS